MRILIALDGAESSERALFKAQELNLLKDAEVVLFHAIPHITLPFSMKAYAQLAEKEELEEAEKYLKRIEQSLQGARSISRVVVFGDPRVKIIEEARSREVDLIVMGTKGTTGAVGFLIGSVAQAVIANSPVPVLVVPSKK